MKILDLLRRALITVLRPIRLNMAFFVFMYVLGCVCAWTTLSNARGAKLYDNLYLELLLDVYVLALVLALLPRIVRGWVRALFYVVLYVVALADVYCFVKFGTTLTPTMLLLVGETDSREAGEFVRTCVSPDVLFSNVGWVLAIMITHILFALELRFPHFIPKKVKALGTAMRDRVATTARWGLPVTGAALTGLLVCAATTSAHNKAATWKLMTGSTIGEVEHTLTEPDHAVLYQPIYRLAFSIYANELTASQVTKLVRAADKVRVDSCSFTSPEIVLIIGESYNRHHAQIYGYPMPTTPRQRRRERSRRLVKFTDVVSPWNLTSFVFKNLFSMHVVGQEGEWCDYPLFPELFRKAGYHVTFLTNQFLPKAKEAVYDFSGGFFLNNPKLSAAQFDTRNDKLHTFDEDLLKDYDKLKVNDGDYNLTIFHLIGQHVNYRQRSPKDRKHFKGDDYKELKPGLNARERGILADYDNATLYNDSIVDEIIRRFEQKEAVVIYVPDHGEECYEGDMHFICRMHSAEIDARLAHAEFDIPFWIWCSKKYVRKHPKITREIATARDRRFMTDALPHLLLYLAGIHAPDYNAKYNLISPEYDEMRPRILKGTTDYDKLGPSPDYPEVKKKGKKK